MSKTVVGIFDSVEYAENAANMVKEQGLRTSDISIVSRQYADEDNTENREPIADGVAAGGVLGGIAGLVIGAGSMVIPGIGLIAAVGPITGLLTGAVTGGIVGGLVDLGIPEENSKEYEYDIKEGKVLWSMTTSDYTSVQKVEDILKNCGAKKVSIY